MKWIVTGGAGFIGCNVVKRLMQLSHEVVVLDDLSRRGTQENLEWLRTQGKLSFVKQDIRDAAGVRDSIASHDDADVLLHLASQVAVTTSVTTGARLVDVPQKGYGNALMGGIAAARGRCVIMGDADDSYDFLEISLIVSTLREGFSLVQGCRLPSGGGQVMPGAMPFLHRWLGNPMFSLLARRWFRAQSIHDVYC